ncbi:DUF4390 domain-containing protein [Neisseriaceae bacterium B1]
MRLLKNNKFSRLFAFRLPETCSGCLNHCAAFLGKLVLFCALAISILPQAAQAEGIAPNRRDAKILSNGQLGISTRFDTELPEQLENALKQGVPLDFALTYQLESPTFASYKFKISQLVSSDNTVNYRLSYHPLTNRYRVSVGTFSTEYNSLRTALKAVGAIANWGVLARGTLSGTEKSEVKARVRLSLTTSKLPKPFQINALNSKDWDLDSGWQDLNIQ